MLTHMWITLVGLREDMNFGQCLIIWDWEGDGYDHVSLYICTKFSIKNKISLKKENFFER